MIQHTSPFLWHFKILYQSCQKRKRAAVCAAVFHNSCMWKYSTALITCCIIVSGSEVDKVHKINLAFVLRCNICSLFHYSAGLWNRGSTDHDTASVYVSFLLCLDQTSFFWLSQIVFGYGWLRLDPHTVNKFHPFWIRSNILYFHSKIHIHLKRIPNKRALLLIQQHLLKTTAHSRMTEWEFFFSCDWNQGQTIEF